MRERLKETFLIFGLRVGVQADIKLCDKLVGDSTSPACDERIRVFRYIQTDVSLPAQVERIRCCLLILKNWHLLFSVSFTFGHRFLENQAIANAISFSPYFFLPPTHYSTSVPVVKMIHHDYDR